MSHVSSLLTGRYRFLWIERNDVFYSCGQLTNCLKTEFQCQSIVIFLKLYFTHLAGFYPESRFNFVNCKKLAMKTTENTTSTKLTWLSIHSHCILSLPLTFFIHLIFNFTPHLDVVNLAVIMFCFHFYLSTV